MPRVIVLRPSHFSSASYMFCLLFYKVKVALFRRREINCALAFALLTQFRSHLILIFFFQNDMFLPPTATICSRRQKAQLLLFCECFRSAARCITEHTGFWKPHICKFSWKLATHCCNNCSASKKGLQCCYRG